MADRYYKSRLHYLFLADSFASCRAKGRSCEFLVTLL